VPWWLVRRHGLDVDRRSDSSAVIRWHWFVGEFDVSLIFQIVATCRELIRVGGGALVQCFVGYGGQAILASVPASRRESDWLLPFSLCRSEWCYLHPTLHFLSTD
jgi:hypothetical protein